MRCPLGENDEVEGPIADDLIGDMNTVARRCIARLW
jgi:hypothetical protein